MKIALAQMDVFPGQPKKNLETMLNMIDRAKKEKVDLIAFPEMCVGGYLLGDKWLDDNYCKDLMEFNEELRLASTGIAVAYGNVFVDEKEDHPNKDGRSRKYNAVYVFQNGKAVKRVNDVDFLPQGIQPKTLLPNYRFFDDERYFLSLEDIAKDYDVSLQQATQPFMIEIDGRETAIGFELCEDLWCEDYRVNGEAVNPTKYLIMNGAEAIVNLSASPWTYGKNQARDRRVKFVRQDVEKAGLDFKPFFYVNCVGAQNNGKNIVTFDGGTTVYDKDAEITAMVDEAYRENLLVIDTSNSLEKVIERKFTTKISEKYNALIRGIQLVKDILGMPVQPRYVIGLSGGVDSAVVAALLANAVGPDNVLAINLPTKYNSAKTKKAAKEIADKLGITYVQIPIEELAEMNQALIDTYLGVTDDFRKKEFDMENIQAKIRGTSLISNVAAKFNAIFTNNGNKLEAALGYATLYGDVNGAIAPIMDLTKVEVFELARYMNKKIFKQEIIPEAMLPDELFRFRDDQILPSAELKEKQVDPMKFGYHDAILDAYMDYRKKTAENILEWYIHGTLEKNLGINTELITRWGIDNPKVFVDDLEWFDRSFHRNVFKRIQTCPTIITSKTAFGYDLRESQLPYQTTLAFDRLKTKVLAMESYQPRGE
ncbi:MAG: NAD(+) synthase [Candidatus Woesearchaeota archaeon]